jgi:RNA-splicing ligase RtcB
VEGGFREDYLHDMRLCQRWAVINRKLIVDLLLDFLVEGGYADVSNGSFESVHNYISDDNIIRKGAISAQNGEKCIIPMNMRDGSLICIGKGNTDWNYSAPHGAGRVLSRARAFKQLTMDNFIRSMDGIYSETVTEGTIDESPMVYKPMEEIVTNIQDTINIVNIIKPVYNYKASE